jgi:hypothetical protein
VTGLLPSPEAAPARKAAPWIARLPLWSGVFLVSARSLSESGRLAALACPRARQRSEAVDVDRGQFVYLSLEDVAVVMRLDELAPVGGRPASGRDRRRFERFTEAGEDLPDRAGLGSGLGGRQPLPLCRLPPRAGAAASLNSSLTADRKPRDSDRVMEAVTAQSGAGR